ncbi:MAG: potassium-transporting ATPase subunit KdpC [Alphaproteobacteria bacterium]|nr:potassium-transporting ATPase subunit KdpC [Alphaproteobacteria bacterium]
MLNMLGVSLRISFLTMLLTGILYPLLVTGGAKIIAPVQAEGSLLKNDQGGLSGSSLIGQSFTKAHYFHGRPSAAGKGYDGMASSGSNYGPTSLALRQRVAEEIRQLRIENTDLIPVDLVTTSASGLDPHISPQAANWQASRIAKARGIDILKVQDIIRLATEGPQFKVLGSAKVNVLILNMALDRQFGKHSESE